MTAFLADAISLNSALCNDLMVRPADSGKASALFTSGADVIGVMAPIVTDDLVSASIGFHTSRPKD
jgi:hypothetical protein